MTKTFQILLILLCKKYILSAPLHTEKKFQNDAKEKSFQEVNIHYPQFETQVLYPIGTQNYEQFKSPYEEYIVGDKFLGPIYTDYIPNVNKDALKLRDETIQKNVDGLQSKTIPTRDGKDGKGANSDEDIGKEATQPKIVKENYEKPKETSSFASDTHEDLTSERQSSRGNLNNQGYRNNDKDYARKEKDHLERGQKEDHSDKGNDQEKHYSNEKYNKKVDDLDEGKKSEKFLEKEGHKKGHKTKGYNNKFHRDEIHREHKFYDDDKDLKDKKEIQFETTVKKKTTKNLDTFDQIYHPKYSYPVGQLKKPFVNTFVNPGSSRTQYPRRQFRMVARIREPGRRYYNRRFY